MIVHYARACDDVIEPLCKWGGLYVCTVSKACAHVPIRKPSRTRWGPACASRI